MDPLRISILGLTRWESVFVQTTVDLASGIDIAPWRLVEDPEGADVLLVDADRRGAASRARNLKSDGPIVVSFSADPSDAGRGLTRPVSYADLISVLKDIEHELSQPKKKELAPRSEPIETPVAEVTAKPVTGKNPVGQARTRPEPVEAPVVPARTTPEPIEQTNKDATPKVEPTPRHADQAKAEPSVAEELVRPRNRSGQSLAERSRPARRFVEGTRFIGLLKQILLRATPVEVTHPTYPTLKIFPRDNAFIASNNALVVPRMFRESAVAFTTFHLDEEVADRLLETDKCQPLGRLVYSAALFGSEGRLVLNSDPADKLRLVDWPDFDAVPQLPEHRTIAKYMLVNTADLAEIVSATGASLRVVIDFCNACEAVGLLRRKSAVEPTQQQGNGGVSQLLNRMRDLFSDS